MTRETKCRSSYILYTLYIDRDMKKTELSVIMVVALSMVLMFGFAVPVVNAHSNSGLKVGVYIQNAGCILNDDMKVTVESNGYRMWKTIYITNENVVTGFKFPSDQSPNNGDTINGYAHTHGRTESGSTINHYESKPESIYINWGCGSNNNNNDGGSASASASNSNSKSDSDSSSSSSSSATVINNICLLGCGGSDDNKNDEN